MILLRPWFLLFALMPLIFWIFKKKLSADNPLERFIDKKLLPYLTVHFNIGAYRLKMRWFLFLWFLLTVAGAGPAFEKIAVPARISAPADVIVMDLSPAMGSHLTKAKLKLHDLITALKGHQIGLVLYDEKGYTATPVTSDLDVILNIIPALSPSVMPRPINKPSAGFKQADELLKNAHVKKGHIIYITAGGFDSTDLQKTVTSLAHPITTLAIEHDKDGYPVALPDGDFMRASNGDLLMVKPDKKILEQIGQYIPMTLDDSDIQKIISHTPFLSDTSDTTQQADMWKEIGPYLLLCGIPFFLWWFRKGAFFILILTLPLGVQAGFFERPDQEKYRKTMTGIEAYQRGNFEAARQVFEHGGSADDWYNAGNAKAHMNDIQGAIKAYDQALKINPNHVDAIWNKEYLQKQLPPQNQSQNNNQDQSNNQQNQSQSSDDSQENTQNQSQSDMSENTQKDTAKSQQADNNQNTPQTDQSNESDPSSQNTESYQEMQNSNSSLDSLPSQPTETQTPPDQDQELSELKNDTQSDPSQPEKTSEQSVTQPSQTDSQSDKKFDQESEQLLNKIKQDPSRLLKYRLYQQYMRNTQ